jgi:hypothetical protein
MNLFNIHLAYVVGEYIKAQNFQSLHQFDRDYHQGSKADKKNGKEF